MKKTDQNFEVRSEVLSDHSVSYAIACERSPRLLFAAMNKEHAYRLCKALNECAWWELVEKKA